MARENESRANRAKVFRAIKELIEENGCSPTLHEISDRSGVAVPKTQWHIKKLQEMGRIEKEYGKSRSIRIKKEK